MNERRTSLMCCGKSLVLLEPQTKSLKCIITYFDGLVVILHQEIKKIQSIYGIGICEILVPSMWKSQVAITWLRPMQDVVGTRGAHPRLPDYINYVFSY